MTPFLKAKASRFARWAIPLSILPVAILSGCFTTTEYMHPRFSQDGRLLTFVYCSRGLCGSVIHDLSDGTYKSFYDPEKRIPVSLSFSPGGRQVVAVVAVADPATGKNDQQLAIGTLGGGRFKVVTQGAGLKMTPVFWDENTVLYWHGQPVPNSNVIRVSLRAVDLAKGTERIVLPEDEGFYRPSAPNPVGDGEHIVFSDYCYRELDDPKEAQSACTDKIIRVSLMKGTKAIVDTGLKASTTPNVARVTGQLYFKGRLEQDEGQRGFAYEVYAKDEKGVRRITHLRTYMGGFAVSPDGRRLAVVVREPGMGNTGRLMLIDTDTGAETILAPETFQFMTVGMQ